MTANESWITQGRQEHGRFGNGTAGGAQTADERRGNAVVGKPTWARRYGWAAARRAAMQAANMSSLKTAHTPGSSSRNAGQAQLAAATSPEPAPDTAEPAGWFARNWQFLRDTASEAYDEVSKMSFLEALANLADASQGMGDPAGHDIAMALRGLERFMLLGPIATNYFAGRAFEAAVLEAIPGLKNEGLLAPRYRTIPDIIDPAAKTITEIKSGYYVFASRQIRLQANGAFAAGWKYNLIVGMSTRVSAAVRDYVNRTGGQIKRFDPVTRTFTSY